MKKNLLLILISIILTLFLIEIILRVFLPQDTSTPWRIYLKDGLLLNKNKGIAYHYFNKNNIKVKYSFGQYHNRKYKLKSSENKILILGDSGIFGWLLNDEDTFVYKLANKFKNYEFINSAAGGQGTSDQLRYLEKFCKKINPKYTLYFINFADIERSKKSNLYFLDKNKNLIKGNNKIPLIYKFVDNNALYDFLVSNFHLVAFLRKSYVVIKDYNFSNKIQKNPIKEKNLTKNNEHQNDFTFEKKLILKLQSVSKKCKTELYIINFAWFNKKIYQSDTYEFLDNNQIFFTKNKINYINLEDELTKKYNEPDKYKIKFDGHPNERANNLYYEILYKKLKNKF